MIIPAVIAFTDYPPLANYSHFMSCILPPTAGSDILAVDWSEDIRVTSSVCARKVTAS